MTIQRYTYEYWRELKEDGELKAQKRKEEKALKEFNSALLYLQTEFPKWMKGLEERLADGINIFIIPPSSTLCVEGIDREIRFLCSQYGGLKFARNTKGDMEIFV